MNQVKDEEQGDEYKDNTGSKGGNFGNPADSHGPVDNHFSPVLQGEALFQKAEMEAIAVHSDIKHIDYVFYDFTEGKRDDSQVVSLQT